MDTTNNAQPYIELEENRIQTRVPVELPKEVEKANPESQQVVSQPQSSGVPDAPDDPLLNWYTWLKWKRKKKAERKRERKLCFSTLKDAANDPENQQVVSQAQSSGAGNPQQQNQPGVSKRPHTEVTQQKQTGSQNGDLKKCEAAEETRGENPQQPDSPDVSQPATSEGTQQKDAGTQTEDLTEREDDADMPNQPHKKLKMEEPTLLVDQSKGVKKYGWRGDISRMFSCILCQYYTPDKNAIVEHFSSLHHKEVLQYLSIFIQHRVNFLHDYLLFQNHQMSLEQNNSNIQPIIDKFKGIGQEEFYHRIQAAHCQACDVLIPDVPGLLIMHKKSITHQQKCKAKFEKTKISSLAVANKVFQDVDILQLLKQYNMKQNPFKEMVCPPEVSTHEVLVSMEDDPIHEDAIADAKDCPGVPVNHNEGPAHETKVPGAPNNPKPKKRNRSKHWREIEFEDLNCTSRACLNSATTTSQNKEVFSEPQCSGDTDVPPQPHKTLIIEKMPPPPERPEVVKNDSWRASDASMMYSCNLCQYHTPDKNQIMRHLHMNQHKEILTHLCEFFPKHRVDFLQDYLLFKRSKMLMEQKNYLKPFRDKFKGISDRHFFHRIEAAHCQACDFLIPDIQELMKKHILSAGHQRNFKATLWKIKHNSPTVARELFRDEDLCKALKQYNMGQDPFVGAWSAKVSSTNDVLVIEAEDNDDDSDDEDTIDDARDDPEVPVTHNQTRSQYGDMKERETDEETGDADVRTQPHKNLKTEEMPPPPEKPEVVKNDGWRGSDASMMYSCALCQYHTPDSNQIKRHLTNYWHKEILRHLGNFFQRPILDFFQNYLLFKRRKRFMKQKNYIKPFKDKFREICECHFFHRIQAAHCQACDVLIPDVRELLKEHVRSAGHQQNYKATFWKIKYNSPAVARELLRDKYLCKMLEKYRMAQDPFKDVAVWSSQVSSTKEVLVCEADDDDFDDEDTIDDARDDPVVFVNHNESPTDETKDSYKKIFLPNEPEMYKPTTSSTTLNPGRTVEEEEEEEEEAAVAP